MPTLDTVLKTEITRLARKAVRAETAALKKSATQQRAAIAALRRQLEELQRSIKEIQKRAGKLGGTDSGSASKAASAADTAVRFRADGLASHRERLGLSASDLGALIGVSGSTIYNWEQRKSRPARDQLARIAAVRSLGRREALRRLEAETSKRAA